MASIDDLPSSPLAPGASPEESLKYYKAQYELLEAELAEFQASSKDLEAELEKDIEAAEKRERQLKDKAASLQFEVDEWKAKHKQSKAEASSVQNTLQKEITELRDANRSLQLRLRDTEVANDDYERKQRNTESSLEDMESKYNQTLERSVLLEEEVKTGEQEREALRIEIQRLKDELSDLKIELDVTKEKFRKAEEAAETRSQPPNLDVVTGSMSPRSEFSPATTATSSPVCETAQLKPASSSEHSAAATPPSPPISEESANASKPFITPTVPRSRLSIGLNSTTPRPSIYNVKTPGHGRGLSLAVNSRPNFRQSVSKAPSGVQRAANLPPSNSMMHLRNLQGKMSKMEQRLRTVKSKLPAPVNTPPKASPRSGSALDNPIPASITVRSSRRRGGGNTMQDPDPGSKQDQGTPSVSRSRPGRQSLGLRPAPSPVREEMAAPPPRPGSRLSIASRSSHDPYVPGHSRPGSRASMSGFRTPLGNGKGTSFAPNASTDRIRPTSSLSNRSGFDGALDEEHEETPGITNFATPTPRRATYSKRTSDIGTAIPSPTKRLSFGTGGIPLPAPSSRRVSSGVGKSLDANQEMRPSSRSHAVVASDLRDVPETYDVDETF